MPTLSNHPRVGVAPDLTRSGLCSLTTGIPVHDGRWPPVAR